VHFRREIKTPVCPFEDLTGRMQSRPSGGPPVSGQNLGTRMEAP
jgi:hypothetical protein